MTGVWSRVPYNNASYSSSINEGTVLAPCACPDKISACPELFRKPLGTMGPNKTTNAKPVVLHSNLKASKDFYPLVDVFILDFPSLIKKNNTAAVQQIKSVSSDI